MVSYIMAGHPAQNKTSNKLTNRLKYIVPYLVMAGVLIWTVLSFRWPDVLTILGRSQFVWTIPVFLTMLLDRICRVIRWRYLLYSRLNIGLWDIYHSYNIGVMMNLILPARMGELTKLYSLCKLTNVPIGDILPSVILEKLLTSFALIVLVFLSCPLLQRTIEYRYGDAIVRWSYLLISASVILPLAGIGAYWWLRRTADRHLHEGCLQAAVRRLLNLVKPMVSSFVTIRNPLNAAITVSLSLIVCFLGVLVVQWCMLGLKFETNIAAGSLLLLCCILGSLLPAGPGGIGASYVGVAIGSSLIGLSGEDGIAIAIEMTIIGSLFSVSVGLISAHCVNLKLSRLRKEAGRLA